MAMDLSRAQSVLHELLCLLPEGWWWPLFQVNPDHNISKVFQRPRLEIDALIVNAGLAKDTKHGFVVRKNQWEAYRDTQLCDLSHGTNRKVHFIATSRPPGEPSKYKNAKCLEQVDLPSHLLKYLRESVDYYNSKIDKANLAGGEKAKANKEKDATHSKIQAMKAARAIQFPHVEEMVDPHEEISLKNAKVAEWANTALLVIVELNRAADRHISVTGPSGIEISLLQLPRSSDRNEFNANAIRTKWDEKMISMLAGDKMSNTESLQCLRSRLDKYDKEIVRGELCL
jgi:hypothetical protein